MYCTRCGCQTGEVDRFCSQCGNLAPGPASTTQPASAAYPPSAFVAAIPVVEGASHQLTRSLRNRKIAGVCAGIGRHFGVDPTIVRILFVAMFFCPILPAIIPYLVCWVVMPLEQPEPLRQVVSSYPMASSVANQPFAPMAR